MIITLIKASQLTSMTLPEKVSGRFWVRYCDEEKKQRKLISIEGVDGRWMLKGNRSVAILEDGQVLKNTMLESQRVYRLQTRDGSEPALLLTEPRTNDRSTYRKYTVRQGARISIGRDAANNICFDNGFVSSCHAVLCYDKQGWSIQDQHSTNGTFVNDRKITEGTLVPGDVVFIMGMSIVIGSDFISVNNPDRKVYADPRALHEFPVQTIERPEAESSTDPEEMELDFFDRSPRFKRDVSRREIKIDSPPPPQNQNKLPTALTLGPSMTMGMMSMVSAGATISQIAGGEGSVGSAITSLMMSVSMILSCVMWPVLTKNFEKKEQAKTEKERQEKYTQYLQEVNDRITRECELQTEILHENFVSIADCAERIMQRKRNLWERSGNHNDFLTLRLGLGELPLDANIRYQEKGFSQADDNLQRAMYSVAETPKLLHDVPITVALTKDYICGITGERDEAVKFARGLILQMTALHSYDEMKLVLVTGQQEAEQWEFARWLPHIWSDDYGIRFFANTVEDVKELSSFLEKEIERRTDSNMDSEDISPYYVIVAADKDLFERAEAFKQILGKKKNIGFSIITLFNELKNLPKECMQVIELDGSESLFYNKDDITGKRMTFRNDMDLELPMQQLAVRMANTHLDLINRQYTMPKMLTFLEMYGVGKIEHLNPLVRWRENDPTKSLHAPIGVDGANAKMRLDLHEKFHGPHGLIAGMTGSGKSEFIITYILSMAVNYHPDEVAFILIDYKGGGLTGAFEDSEKGIKLPHLAGTITNLDGASVKRSLISIQSELRRRQAIFNEARKVSNEGTMDIYKYQKLRRDGVVSEAVPHLFIISDEFAELKQQQPDFMEQLISAARIGRSLGVHLILATQKPSGVVDDQIWSNSRFRVCLKVQENADSNDMIKRPDAAALSVTGRFFLQVGFNEYFGEGQSAWCGAPYVPSDFVVKQADDSIRVVDHIGRTIKEVKPVSNQKEKAQGREIVAIVKYLSDLAREEDIRVRQLWLEAIPALIYTDQLEEKYGWQAEACEMNPIIGEYDDPFNQDQRVMTLPLSREGNAIIYGYTGSGTQDMITTMIHSLIAHHTPDEVNLYLLDMGAETLRCFAAAPHVGDVVYSTDTEKVINLMNMLKDEVQRRKKLFSDAGGSYQSYCDSGREVIPSIVVVINNFAAFAELFDDLENDLCLLARDGSRAGIHFVLTAAAANSVRYKVAQNFKQMLVMQLNDETDYSSIIGNTDGVYPSRIKGRGIVRYDKVYEFQAAHVVPPEQELEYIRQYCDSLKGKYRTQAKRIPILPDVVDSAFLEPYVTDLTAVPVGVAKESLQIANCNFQSSYISLVSAQDRTELVPTTLGLVEVLQQMKDLQVTVWDADGALADANLGGAAYCGRDFNEHVVPLFFEVVSRNNRYKDAGEDKSVLDGDQRKVYILFGIKRLLNLLGEDEKEKMELLLEKGEAIYKIHFILCEAENELSGLAYQPWFSHHVNTGDGIWVGDGFGNQYTLKSSKMVSSLYAEIGSGFGYVLRKGKAILTKLLQP